ncbi:MAG TPA: UDP-N-acetylmuramate dehydrogenase [Candidatus Saccharimonadales bacterium]|jgi:UDP-N-acetylmuramate dehydrogenase
MNIFNDVALADYSTMHLGGTAAHVAEIHDRGELTNALAWAEHQQLPVVMIGGGSNIYWRDEGFSGLLLVNRCLGYEDFAEDESNHYLTIGAGENWDSVIERSVQAGLTGIEALSLVPGTAGATPIQNVGAYGQEIAQTLVSVEAYDNQAKKFVTIPTVDCAFGYRTSRFKTGADKGRFFITAITLHLIKGNLEPPFYKVLDNYFVERSITEFSPQVVRDAVIAIRSAKLPDPALVSNNGSFFANPVVDEGMFVQIQADYPGAPHWPQENGQVKLPAAWLLEQAGFKDIHDPETGMATWPTQTLVLVNEHARSEADLEKFKQKILTAVQQKFHITLEQEPELLP